MANQIRSGRYNEQHQDDAGQPSRHGKGGKVISLCASWRVSAMQVQVAVQVQVAKLQKCVATLQVALRSANKVRFCGFALLCVLRFASQLCKMRKVAKKEIFDPSASEDVKKKAPATCSKCGPFSDHKTIQNHEKKMTEWLASAQAGAAYDTIKYLLVL